jgi:hypothetical protein
MRTSLRPKFDLNKYITKTNEEQRTAKLKVLLNTRYVFTVTKHVFWMQFFFMQLEAH